MEDRATSQKSNWIVKTKTQKLLHSWKKTPKVANLLCPKKVNQHRPRQTRQKTIQDKLATQETIAINFKMEK